jgi:hypothetical protein
MTTSSRSFIIQYTGDQARQEAINVGIVVYNNQGERKVKLTEDVERLKAFGCEFLENLLKHTEEMLGWDIGSLENHRDNAYMGVLQVINGPSGILPFEETYELVASKILDLPKETK